MDAYLHFLALVRSRLTEARHRNASYSLNAFAKKIGLAPSTLSMVLKGRRRLSTRAANRVADCLIFNPTERGMISEILRPTALSDSIQKKQVSSSTQASFDQQFIFSEWHYLAILNLIRLKDFNSSPSWIAKRLGLSKNKTEEAINRLLRLGMMAKSENGKFTRTAISFRSTDDVINTSLKKSHYQNLKLMKKSLDLDPLEERDFSWITFSFERKRMKEAKAVIRKFEVDFAEAFTLGEKNDGVYRLSVQIIPLTKNCDIN